MKKVNKKRKELSTAVLLIIILLFSIIILCFGISIGFLINSFINYSTTDILTNAVLTLLVGIVYMTLLLTLLRNKDSENIKSSKWYINCILISFTITLIVSAITVFVGAQGDSIINYLVGFAMFPFIGIITTPNIVKHVKNDTTSWKNIFYKKGNIHSIKDSNDYYRVTTPVSFEKKILSIVYKEQIKNLLVVIGIMALVIFIFLNHIMREHSYSGRIVSDLIKYRSEKAFGFIFFLTIFFTTFGIPIIAYYISNALKKIRVVKNHEYIAFHAIVSGVHNGKIAIYAKNKHYNYNYCTCVGIKEKDIHQIPVTLIFIPDDVLLFPDNEEYKVEKYNKKK